MLKVYKNNNVVFARGDTIRFELFINQGTLLNPIRYNLNKHNNWEIYLGIMEPNQKFEYADIKFKFTRDNAEITQNGDLVVQIDPKLTENLYEGKYYYQIKMKHSRKQQEFITSLIPKTQMQILD